MLAPRANKVPSYRAKYSGKYYWARVQSMKHVQYDNGMAICNSLHYLYCCYIKLLHFVRYSAKMEKKKHVSRLPLLGPIGIVHGKLNALPTEEKAAALKNVSLYHIGEHLKDGIHNSEAL